MLVPSMVSASVRIYLSRKREGWREVLYLLAPFPHYSQGAKERCKSQLAVLNEPIDDCRLMRFARRPQNEIEP